MQDLKWKFLIITAIAAIFGYIAWPSENKPGFRPGSAMENVKLNLGLDLQGGAWFRVRLKPEGLTEQDIAKGTEEAMNILERRINLRGLKEPRIYRQGTNEIQIEVPGLKTSQQVEQFKKVILGAGHLEFKLEAPRDVQAQYDRNKTAPAGFRYYEPADPRSEQGGLLVEEGAIIEGKGIAFARPGHDEGGRPEVNFELTNEGARVFEQVTGANVGKRLAIILDGRLISAPTIQSKIGKSGVITGRFTNEEVADMVTVLRTGSLRAPLEIVGSSFLGPALGQDSIDRGMKACYFSLIVVMVFMLVYYRHAGMVANVAMIINVTMILGLLALFGATLTLPGIAGIVLTMGMAVDANILVFERMREEKDAGKAPQQQLEAGFDRAFSAIVDANLTTMVIAVILYYFGSGPVQGFGTTLFFGILTTLFTALTCSKVMLRLMISTGMVKEWSMMRAMSKPNIPFMKLAPRACIASVVLIVIGTIVWFARGDDKYGIDFRGGVAINIRFKKPTPIEEVRKGIADISGPQGPKYPAAEVVSVILGADASGASESREFKVRTLAAGGEGATDPEKVKNELEADLRKQFAGRIPDPSIQQGLEEIAAPNPYAGGGTFRISLGQEHPAKEMVDRLQKKLAAIGVMKPGDADKPYVRVLDAQGNETAAEKSAVYEVWLMPSNWANWPEIADRITDDLKGTGFALSEDPFPMVETVSASIVSELKDKAIISLALSWIMIILYLAIRFDFRYGIAAVLALIHDSVIAILVTVMFHAVLPKSLGIDLSVTLTTIAAALTIIGYSVNDTVVIFDRMRENMRDLKTKGLAQVIDDSLNQTLSRTIITALTVFFTVTILLAVTLTSGGGIAAMSFPLLVGVIAGTYSSLFIAAPVIYWWRMAKKGESKA